MRRLLPLTLAPAALALVIAGCGGGGSPPGTASSGGAYSAPKPAAGQAAATVGTERTSLGNVLVDAQGRTVYLFEKDKGDMSTCYGSCASIWPPVATGARVKVAGGVEAARLGSTRRTDGKTELTYGGHPLYTYAGDAKAGDVKGQGLNQFGAEWYVLAPSGNKIDNG